MAEVDETGRKLIEQLLFEDEDNSPPATLHHYTGVRGFRGIVESQSIWASHIRYLNDSSEYERGLDLADEHIKSIKRGFLDNEAKILDTVMDDIRSFKVFVASFTNDGGNRLSQWRGYCSSGSGYSLGFSHNSLKELTKKADSGRVTMLKKCSYSDQQFDQSLQHLFNLSKVRLKASRLSALGTAPPTSANILTNLAFNLAAKAAVLKHSGFKEEEEWRLVVIETQPNGIKTQELSFHEGKSSHVAHLVIPLPVSERAVKLDQVVIGPSPLNERDSLASVNMLIEHFGATCQTVKYSGIPYRYW